MTQTFEVSQNLEGLHRTFPLMLPVNMLWLIGFTPAIGALLLVAGGLIYGRSHTSSQTSEAACAPRRGVSETSEVFRSGGET